MALVGERVENGMGENNCGTGWGESREWNGREQENNCGIGWEESREWNGREQERTTVALVGGESREWNERTTVALVGERVENGMGENRREQLWHWLGRE